MAQLLLIGLGGALGGVARLWVAGVVDSRGSHDFPWGTLMVNASGALCVGILAGLLGPENLTAAAADPLWLALVVGVLGSYTTVSAFSLQTVFLLRDGGRRAALLNIVASFALCLGAAAVGYLAVGGALS